MAGSNAPGVFLVLLAVPGLFTLTKLSTVNHRIPVITIPLSQSRSR